MQCNAGQGKAGHPSTETNPRFLSSHTHQAGVKAQVTESANATNEIINQCFN